MPSTYQVARKGADISGQCSAYTAAPAAPASSPAAPPACAGRVGASPRIAQNAATKIGEDANVSWGPTILATLIAFGVGFAVIAWLMRWLSTKSYLPFVIYRLVLAVVVVILLGAGAVTATGGV